VSSPSDTFLSRFPELAKTLSGSCLFVARVLEAVLCLAGEPMDSLCGEAAPREASHVCRPEVTPAAIADIQQEGPERPVITGAQQEVQERPVITGAQQEVQERPDITGAQQEVQESPVITGAQQEGPDDSQTSRKDPESVAAERTTAAAPQAGKDDASQTAWRSSRIT